MDQVRASVEVLGDLVKTPTDLFCRFAQRILTEPEVLDTVSRAGQAIMDKSMTVDFKSANLAHMAPGYGHRVRFVEQQHRGH